MPLEYEKEYKAHLPGDCMHQIKVWSTSYSGAVRSASIRFGDTNLTGAEMEVEETGQTRLGKTGMSRRM